MSGLVLVPELRKVHDPRSPLAKMRRIDVYTFASHYKVPFTPGEPAEDVRDKISRAGYTGAEPVPADVERIGCALIDDGDKKAIEEGREKLGKDYASMKFQDLRKEAKRRGMKQSPKDKKTDLVRKLSGENITSGTE